MKRSGSRIVVAGSVAHSLERAGATWTVLQYVSGLRKLGHDVLFVEPVPADLSGAEGEGEANGRSDASAYFQGVVQRFGLTDRAALFDPDTRSCSGVSYPEVLKFCQSAELLLNFCGVLRDPALVDPIPIRAFMDLAPASTQSGDPEATEALQGHDRFFTTALSGGTGESRVVSRGIRWQPLLQPVVLDDWPIDGTIRYHALTAVARWHNGHRGSSGPAAVVGSFSLDGYLTLPERARARFLLALTCAPREAGEIEALRSRGWGVVDPTRVADTPDGYRAFVQGSIAEFALADPRHSTMRSGWFGSRSAFYLASGRPALVQDTGLEGHLPLGEGILPFENEDDVLAGVEALHTDYRRHAREARGIAEAHFDSDLVLPDLLERIGRGSRDVSRSA